MKKQEEEFKDIPGFEGFYQVSEQGNVRSMDREVITEKGSRTYKGRRLKPGLNGNGYLMVGLSINGKRKTYSLHTLVARVFLGHISDGHETVVNHKDNNPSNNCLSNLDLRSQRENSSIDKWRYNHSSKAIGVSWHKRDKIWVSNINIGDKYVYLGTYEDQDEAAKAYKLALLFIDRFDGDTKEFRTFIKSKIYIKE